MSGVIVLPLWLQVLVAVATVLSAVAMIWRGLIRPAVQLVALANRMVPLAEEMVDAFEDAGSSPMHVLADVVAEFRNDHGSTLRDAVDRIEAQIGENTAELAELRQRVVQPAPTA